MTDKQPKKVSVFWQCLASLFIPTGLYAFNRIKKLKLGGLIYGITFAIWIVQGLIIPINNPEYFGIFGLYNLLVLFFGVIIPILFIRQWSIEWNNSISNKVDKL